jgi:glycosyltransferase involved in cell wall biosynthesis
VRSGETGLLVADAEPTAYAEAIARIAGDPGLHRRLSQGARAFVTSERSLAAAAATLDRHLAPLVAARRWG